MDRVFPSYDTMWEGLVPRVLRAFQVFLPNILMFTYASSSRAARAARPPPPRCLTSGQSRLLQLQMTGEAWKLALWLLLNGLRQVPQLFCPQLSCV